MDKKKLHQAKFTSKVWESWVNWLKHDWDKLKHFCSTNEIDGYKDCTWVAGASGSNSVIKELTSAELDIFTWRNVKQPPKWLAHSIKSRDQDIKLMNYSRICWGSHRNFFKNVLPSHVLLPQSVVKDGKQLSMVSSKNQCITKICFKIWEKWTSLHQP